ncbi:Biopolymer transporter ExbD [Sulfidibacter corallicola]|uniref:Biopolymer transporter ExbD n=1 Tax=Sulfidibacter corallicola TaxID=2818388 RepID=A0A8A4TVT3_SULCO|nr:biopolymer transporter ExbD [Sulfidibacter corallicola]QTD53278.1 biopolymer transporter ExbD [Sulfidibacter corallicola]
MSLQQKKEEPEIPTASMADIAFLLIVFFMLTTVFSANKGMEHILPPKEENDDVVDPQEAVYIQIFPSGQFTMDQTSYYIDDVEKVYEYVNSKVQVNAKKPIIVDANPEARYGDMVAILDQLKLLSAELKQDLAITIPTPEERELYQQMRQ